MKRLFTHIFFTLCCCGSLLAATPSAAGPADDAPYGIFDLIASEEFRQIELHVNFDSLEVYRRSTDRLPATASIEGEEYALNVTVRGRFRRTRCVVPPLMLQFAKKGLKARGLNTHNDLKLVTHCTDGKEGQDALLREQLTYELYNILNPGASFRTHLLEVTYVNTADGSTTTSYGIVIEDTDQLRKRLGTKNCKDCYNLPTDQISNAGEITLFQYMIGNSDFSLKNIRNAKILRDKETGEYLAVPYDFDFSGVVNAPYATGFRHFQESHVTDRTLIWENASGGFDAATYAPRFQEVRAELFDHVEQFEGLAKKSKKEVRKYLQDFYDQLDANTIGQS